MKNAKLIAVSAWFLFLFTLAGQSMLMISCTTPKSNFTSSQTVKDSTWVKKTVTPFDSIIKLPGTKVQVSADLNNLKDGDVIQQKLDNLTATLSRVGNTVTADCDQAELEMIIQLQRELIEIYKTRDTDTKQAETIPVREPYIPWYIYPLLCLGGLAIPYVIFQIIKNYFKPKI
ncbi:hypothetical protein [Flavobacterium cerinum]|uniref:Uncharacterized protein n=1 Tax=Flavobacterium cerinum TaxID=2502784 RepID=A0A444HBP9_9FLAO|nr:hypothetical protein [Flavobacterium cerinum]RWX00918.1 hypothetical protein EPI11_07810 [Flavobacterium cerinum]